MAITGYLFGAAVAFGLGALVTLSGCSSPAVTYYRESKPKLDIRKYFDGEMIAFGTIEDYSGKIVNRFIAKIEGSWQGDVGTLKEDFVFDDGKKEQRIWTLTMKDDDSFTGQAHDVVGVAQGKQSGSALNMKYTLKREINGKMMEFSMDDWMYQIDDTYLINKTKMKKFGITVAELTIGFHKLK